MRPLLFALLPLSILGGCRGYLADHVRPEASIMGPELVRYGFASGQAQCVGDRLVETLSTWQLRQLANVTKLIKEPGRLTPSELVWVSGHVKDDRVPQAVRQAAEGCAVSVASASASSGPAEAAAAEAPSRLTPAPPTPAEPVAAPSAETAAPSAPSAPAAAPASRWLNLGSGADKKAISIDASTLQGEMPLRSAWFRIIAPGAAGTANSYLLQIDCTAKTVNPLASRKHDEKGAVTEEMQHGPNGAGANAIQGGSVIEIAYLSLCT